MLVPILLHLWLVYQLAVNIPYIDDYTFLLDCLHWQLPDLTLTDYLKQLFYPHGEHVILFARLTVLADYWIEGSLNFRTLFFIGNLTFLGTVWLLVRLARRSGIQPLYLLPVTLFLFQPQSYENTTTWAICALQHLPALFFAFLAFDLISRPSERAFLLSLPVAFLAVFSNGNGLITLGVGFLVVLALKNRFRLIVWLGFMAVCLGLYLYIHHQSHSPAIGTNLTHPVRVLVGFFLMVGSIGLVFTRSLAVLSAIGFAITALSGLVVITGVYQLLDRAKRLSYLPAQVHRFFDRSLAANTSFLVLTACFLYTVLTLFSISFARSLGWYNSLLLPRFIWFATIAFAVGYLLILLWFKPSYRPLVGRVALLIGLLINGFSYGFGLGEVTYTRQLHLSDITNWQDDKILVSLPANTRQLDHFYSDILAVAQQKGVYKLPQPLSTFALDTKAVSTSLSNVVAKDSSFLLGDRQIRYLTIETGLLKSAAFSDKEVYLVARSARHRFIWPVNQSYTKLAPYLMTGKADWGAAMVWVFDDQVPLDSYQISLAWSEKGDWHIAPTTQSIKLGTQL
ncbi:hypothetical protein [Spirosoma agri]|uniref:YfhO family protein n=1 Tax=Spirosoma agri TaxID=1987381 RepID=A0A6M0IS39_9BACT|nr:hypothetical protein [Spirosoma agri]NEU70914.1 hypothetical protein [Spirosoma agri]